MSFIKLIYFIFAIFICSNSNVFSRATSMDFGKQLIIKHINPLQSLRFIPMKERFTEKLWPVKQGHLEETLYPPRSRAIGLLGRPYYCGLDIIWVYPATATARESAKGHVIDPRSGKVYSAKLWVEKGNLVLRGEFMMFGKNEVLFPYLEQNFNAGFQKPDLHHFTPTSFH